MFYVASTHAATLQYEVYYDGQCVAQCAHHGRHRLVRTTAAAECADSLVNVEAVVAGVAHGNVTESGCRAQSSKRRRVRKEDVVFTLTFKNCALLVEDV